MNQPNSFTSSSEVGGVSSRRGWATLGWVITWLIVLDFMVNLFFAYPPDPQKINPSALALYFDYGRSMESRLRRGTRSDPTQSAPITKTGWYNPLVAVERPAKPDGVKITFYGMSHAVRLADALQENSPRFQTRSVGAPGATTNWAYGAFLRDKRRSESQAAVLAIMSSTLPMILSPAPMDWNTSFAMPYTADRFTLRGGKLQANPPPYESFDHYVKTLNEPAAWNRALGQFSQTDPFYEEILFRQSWLDNSTIFRLVRRAWSQRRDRAWRGRVLTAQSYEPDSEAVQVANAIISDFAARARAQGIVPVIYVVDSFGYSDQLYRSLKATLVRENISYVATHDVVNPMDAVGYLPDSHFTDENDRRIALQLERVLERELANPVDFSVNPKTMR